MNSGEMRIAVVDDNAADRRLLEGYLEKYRKEKECSFTVVPYENSIEFLESYGQGYDVVFLDIEMPGMNGLETAEELRKADDSVGIIFITNMAQYAIRGYEVNAIDFMVKPVGYYNFSLKLEKALDFAEKKQMKTVTVATRDQIVRLTQQQVWYVEKDKNYVIYHTEKGTYKARGTMQEVKEKLDSFLFAESEYQSPAYSGGFLVRAFSADVGGCFILLETVSYRTSVCWNGGLCYGTYWICCSEDSAVYYGNVRRPDRGSAGKPDFSFFDLRSCDPGGLSVYCKTKPKKK